MQAEILKVKEIINRSDFSKMYLVQVAVNGQKCIPFWSFESDRRRLGEHAWGVSLIENAAEVLAKHGPCSDTLV